MRIEARIDAHQSREASKQQSRPDEQHERQRDLGHHERGAKAQSALPRRNRATFLLEHRGELRRNACTAGASPNRSPVAIATASANSRTVPSTRTSASRGTLLGWRTCRNFTPSQATATPATPPNNASTRLSVSSWRINRPRLARVQPER